MVTCISWYKLKKTFVKYLNIICFNSIFSEKKVMNFIYCCKTMNKYLQGITIVVAYTVTHITIIPKHCKYSYYLKDMNLFKLKRNSIIFKSFLHNSYIVYFSNWKTQVFYISFNLHNRDNVIPFKINSS